MKNETSIKALVRLIEDPDDAIFEHVRDEIISHGTSAIPFLESSWEEEDYGLLFQSSDGSQADYPEGYRWK